VAALGLVTRIAASATLTFNSPSVRGNGLRLRAGWQPSPGEGASYKGKIMEGTLLLDGTLEFQQKRYNTCSTAAEIARGTLTGRRMHTNGWDFWQFLDSSGKTRILSDARQSYLACKGGG
jgi:hypothetical protein